MKRGPVRTAEAEAEAVEGTSAVEAVGAAEVVEDAPTEGEIPPQCNTRRWMHSSPG